MPKGMVEDVVYGAASKNWLLTLIREVEGDATRKRVLIDTIHGSYKWHYRRMVPDIMDHLEFRNTYPNPQLVAALQLLKSYGGSKETTYPHGVTVPIKGIVPNDWHFLVVGGTARHPQINCVAYEICVLMVLREKLRCREMWVVGARRYRNPGDDLPKDFVDKRSAYYADLGIKRDAKAYVRDLREEMTEALKELDRTLPSNPYVTIAKYKDGHRFCVTPLKAMDDPVNLAAVKDAVFNRWGGTNLLDVLKEVDLQLQFTRHFRSGTEQTRMEKNTMRRRLLLCIYALGTNTGIKSMEAGFQVEYRELLYVRRRFISADAMREAIATVINATFAIRKPEIWGGATTACGADSKQFGCWDQNLLTEYHMRYGGRGVMAYWHVDKHATCVFSQLKRVSSSEVAAMFNGIIQHCTDMEIDRQYVDTHGQSTVAFGLADIMKVDLLPRIKGINRLKLYRSTPGLILPYLDNKVMHPRFIDWDLIEYNYDAVVQHVVALKLGITDAESLLRQFTKNSKHPAYGTMIEIGKVRKNILLMRGGYNPHL